MNTQKLVSRRNGEVAEVVKVENGIYTLAVNGKQVEVKEGTVKRWWKKEETLKKVSEQENDLKKETEKVKSNEIKIKSNDKQFKETKLPLKSLYHAVRFSNNKWFFKKFDSFNQEQKDIVIDYLFKNGNEKHKKFLIKNNLKKEEK